MAPEIGKANSGGQRRESLLLEDPEAGKIFQ